jgi:hypothetical protein
METVPINPSKPVAGNLAGTFAGFVAILATGYISSHGWFFDISHFISVDPAMCAQIEDGLFVFTLASIGSIVNYGVTHFAQVRKLKELYDMIPEVRAEYEQTGMPKSQDPKRK